MKKIISILLVLVILISSLCPTSVFAAMEDTNLDWTNTTNWIFNDGSSKNIGTNAGAVAYTGGSGVTVDRDTFAATRGTTLKLDSGGFYASLPLNTEKNTKYKLTFSYYTDKVGNVPENANPNIAGKTYANFNTGIFIPNHPDFEGVSRESSRVGFAYTMTYLNYYASNFQMNTPAGHLWTVDSTGKKTGFADQDGDGNADGDVRTYNAVDNYHGIEVGKWYTLSFEFNSSNFEDIAFTLQKNGGEMWIDDIILEKSVEDDDFYFEDTSKWVWSLRGTSTQTDRKNIALASDTHTTYATGYATNNTAIDNNSASDDGQSVKLTSYGHAYNIPLPDLEKNSTYSIEFSYKLGTLDNKNTEASNAFGYMGIYSPEFMDSKLTAVGADISNLSFTNRSVGWAAVDWVYNGGLYRYRDDTLETGGITANRYYQETAGYTFGDLEGKWIKEKIVFSVTNYDDLHLVIVPETTSGILLDDFKLVKLENAFENPDVWRAINNDNTVNANSQPVAQTLQRNGSDVKTLKMSGSAGVYATKLTTEKNHYYSFSFDYYGTELGSFTNAGTTYKAIIESCGVAELNDDGKLIKRDHNTDNPPRIYTTYLSLSFKGNTKEERLPSQVCLKEIDANGTVNNEIRGDNDWYTISFEFASGDNDALEFYIDPFISGEDTFNVANFQLKDLNVIETQNKVGIRAKSDPNGQGIRVRNRIPKANITGDPHIVSYGAIAIRTARLKGDPLTFDILGIATGVAYNTKEGNCGGKIQTKPILREQTDKDNIFSCVLINIPQKYYGHKYSVRSFAIDDAGNVYYGEVVEVSVFDVVYSILNSDTATKNDIDTANSIVSEIIEADNNDTKNEITTYADWCTANGLTDKSTAA